MPATRPRRRVTRQRAPPPLDVPPHHTLLDILRDDLGLTGTKSCCLVGECGACTVDLDGRIVDSCLVLAAEVDGSDVTTVEGVAPDGALTALQEAFLDHGAVQCGYCIPGQVMAARDALCGASRIPPMPTSRRAWPGTSAGAAATTRSRRPSWPRPMPRERRSDDAAGSANRPPRRRHRRGSPAPRTMSATSVCADMLDAALVTVDCAHARILRSTRPRRSRSLASASCTTAADLPQPVPRFGPQFRDRPVLAAGETLYHGEPVAAVVAETRDAALEAASLVRVEYEPLPAVLTIADRPRDRMRRSCATPPFARATRAHRRTSSMSTTSAGATSTPSPARPTSWSAHARRSRW